MKTQYVVKAMKYFHSGSLKGLSVDVSVSYPTLDSAADHVKMMLKHTEKPVKELLTKSQVTYHTIRIVTE